MGSFFSSTGGKVTVSIFVLLLLGAAGYVGYQYWQENNSSSDPEVGAVDWQIQKPDEVPVDTLKEDEGDKPKIIPVDSFDTGTAGSQIVSYPSGGTIDYDELYYQTGGGGAVIIAPPGLPPGYTQPAKDPAPPAPRIKSGPDGLVGSGNVSFTFTGEGEFRCSLNRPAYRQSAPCSSPREYSNLRDGQHVFRVWSQNGNNHSPSAARSFQVDTKKPPAPSITSGPSGPTRNSSPQFTFTGSSGLGFLCSFGGESFKRCSSPYRTGNLTDGSYSFRVRTVDRAGNESGIKSRSFQVDTVAPAAPVILSGPDGDTTDTSPVFTFSGTDSFLCSMDSASPGASCTSPAGYASLGEGAHTFRVWSEDAAGNRSAASSRSFTILLVTLSKPRASRASTRGATQLNPSNYSTGDTSSSAGETQDLTLEIDPAIEILAIASDSDTVSPQAGGDTGAGDDASFTASVDLRSNLSWTSSAVESEQFGLQDGALTITGDGDTGGSNGTAAAGDGTQNYGVQFAIDVSWADDASPEATPYDATVDHDVANAL